MATSSLHFLDGVPRCPSGGQKEVEQARICQIAGLVIGHFLPHGDRQRLGQPAMDLPFDDHRVDARAAIVKRVEAADLGDTAVDVDMDDADISAERIGHVRRVIITDRLEPRLHPRRDIVVGGESELGHRF